MLIHIVYVSLYIHVHIYRLSAFFSRAHLACTEVFICVHSNGDGGGGGSGGGDDGSGITCIE